MIKFLAGMLHRMGSRVNLEATSGKLQNRVSCGPYLRIAL